MMYSKAGNTYFVRLVPGEEFISTLTEFANKQGIKAASVQAIGAASEMELGIYYQELKKYAWKVYTGQFELLSALGNISTLDDKPIPHIHATFSDEDQKAFGAHVKRMIVHFTCEIVITSYDAALPRAMDTLSGLNLWNCDIKEG